MKVFCIFSLTLFFALASAASQYKRVCYYYDPATLPIDRLNFTVCTHIIYYGVLLYPNNYTFHWPKPGDAAAIEALKQARNKYGFQLMTVLGGSQEEISGSQDNMTLFANAAVSFLRKNGLDGLDFDWEFPMKKYKTPYANLLKTVRKAFDKAGKPRLILSMAATGVELLIIQSYDIPSFNESLDFLDIMGYDYRAWETKFYLTAHHSPLYAAKYDTIYLNTLNLDWSAKYFANHGLAKEKIVLGLPTYAHSWNLLTTFSHGLFAPATGTATPPTLGYADICSFVKENGTVRVWDDHACSPYAYNGKRWYCFDDFESVRLKADYVKRNNYGGVMIWSLFGDYDPKNQCETGTNFPIHSLLADLL